MKQDNRSIYSDDDVNSLKISLEKTRRELEAAQKKIRLLSRSSTTKKPRNKRRERALETKDKIYAAAINLMDRKGFENITIADISKKAGVSVGAFYHYFKSKNDILAEIFRKADEYFSRQVITKLEKGNIADQVVEYFDYYAKFNHATGAETTQIIFNPKIKFFIKGERPMLTILQDLIRKGQEKGEIRTVMDPEELGKFLIVLARGIVFDWSLYDGHYDLETTMHKYIEALVSTLRS